MNKKKCLKVGTIRVNFLNIYDKEAALKCQERTTFSEQQYGRSTEKHAKCSKVIFLFFYPKWIQTVYRKVNSDRENMKLGFNQYKSTFTVGRKIIRAREIIRVKKLIPNAVL